MINKKQLRKRLHGQLPVFMPPPPPDKPQVLGADVTEKWQMIAEFHFVELLGY